MKIDLKQLVQGEPVDLRASEHLEGLDLAAVGIRIVSPIEINAQVIKFPGTLDVKIALKAKARIQCCRCLAEAEIPISKKLRLDYPISPQEDSIDMSEDIRQEIMVEYPLKPLCSLDCKGLCSHCGKNLNEGPCQCKKL